jgi:hypothetical protein
MKNRVKIDLTLMKKLLGGLEEIVNIINADHTTEEAKHDMYIALSKASGILGGIAQEAVSIITIVYTMMQEREAEASPKTGSILDIFSSTPYRGRNKN